MIPIEQIRVGYKRIKPFIHNTIVLKSDTLNNLSNSSLFFKCENFQKSGSFKIRGASNTILQIKKEKLKKGHGYSNLNLYLIKLLRPYK